MLCWCEGNAEPPSKSEPPTHHQTTCKHTKTMLLARNSSAVERKWLSLQVQTEVKCYSKLIVARACALSFNLLSSSAHNNQVYILLLLCIYICLLFTGVCLQSSLKPSEGFTGARTKRVPLKPSEGFIGARTKRVPLKPWEAFTGTCTKRVPVKLREAFTGTCTKRVPLKPWEDFTSTCTKRVPLKLLEFHWHSY